MRTLKSVFTAEELLHLPTTGRRLDLVKGKVYEAPPAGGKHGSVAMNVGIALGSYVRSHGLGRVFAAETGFILRRDPDTVRAPDAAFVAGGRLPQEELPTGYLELAPDLVVEVVSPHDVRREVREKVADWLRAGTRLVWVIDPGRSSATVYLPEGDVQELSENDNLEGGEVVPGFSTGIRELLS